MPAKVHIFSYSASLSFPHPYHRRPELNFLIAAKAKDRVADAVVQIAEVFFVGAENEQERFEMLQVKFDIMF